MKEQTCKTCYFYQPDPYSEVLRGLCKKHSPTYITNGDYGAWPKVFDDDWCGDYAHKESE